MHEILQIEAINVRLHNTLDKLWLKIEEKEPEIYQHSEIENRNNFSDHNWWLRAANTVAKGAPAPIYTQANK